LTYAENTRARSILVVAAKNALDKIYNADKAGRLDGHWTSAHRYAEQAFHKAILQLCDEIIQAAKAKVKPPSSFKEQREKQTAARKALADELRAGRQDRKSGGKSGAIYSRPCRRFVFDGLVPRDSISAAIPAEQRRRGPSRNIRRLFPVVE